MGFWDFGKKVNTTPKNNWVQVDANGKFYHYINQMLSSGVYQKFDPLRPVYFASTIAEIFAPIDIISDRVASCKFNIYNKNTDKIVENLPNNLVRLLKNPNPFNSLSELIYQIQFSELASGGSFVLTKMPSTFKTKTVDRISNIWVLNPDTVEIKIKKSIPNPYLISDISELIEMYNTHWLIDMSLNTDEVNYNSISQIDENLKTKTPLLSVTRNINNLLAVYSARFNVYDKNGVAGIVFKDDKGASTISEQINPITRDRVLEDLNNMEGIVGDKMFTGISSFPLGFIETLGKIKDLEPFKEAEVDSMAIASIFGVSTELIYSGGSSTFSNKRDAEKHLWQNIINPYAEDISKTLTKIFYLPEDWEFRKSTDNIEILQSDRKTQLEADTIELSNIKILQELGMSTEQINKKLTQWIQK